MNREFTKQLNIIVGEYWSQRDGVARQKRESASGNGFAPSSPCVASAILKQSLGSISSEVVDRFFQFCENEANEQFKDIQHGVRPPDQAFDPFLKDNENGLLSALGSVIGNLKKMAAKNPSQAVGNAQNARIEAEESRIQTEVTNKFERGRQQFAREVLRLKCSRRTSGIPQTGIEANGQSVTADGRPSAVQLESPPRQMPEAVADVGGKRSQGKQGRKPATADKINKACEVWIDYHQEKRGRQGFCDWWNAGKPVVGHIGRKWLDNTLSWVRNRLIPEGRVPEEYKNKFESLKRVKPVAKKTVKNSRPSR